MPNRIAAVLSRWPFPPVGGRERMLLQHLAALAVEGELTIFCAEPAGERPAFLRDIPVVTIPQSGVVGSIWRVMTRSLSFQEAYYSSVKGARILADHHRAAPFDAVYVDMVRMAGVTRLLPANRPRLVLDYDDRLSRRYRAMATMRGASLMGTRGADFPPAIRFLSRFVSSAVLKMEARRMDRRERYWGGQSDWLLFSSGVEAREFAEETGLRTVTGVPLLPAEGAPALVRPAADARLVFVGNLGNTQNRAAFQTVTDHMAARQARGEALAVLHVFGHHDAIVLPGPLAPFVVFHGFADTLAQVAAEPSILIAPIAFGSGIKTKVFDCMAVGIPVVTTLRGIEGLEVTPNTDCAIVEDAGAAYNEAVAIAADPVRFLALREAALAFIATQHHEAAALHVYRQALHG